MSVPSKDIKTLLNGDQLALFVGPSAKGYSLLRKYRNPWDKMIRGEIDDSGSRVLTFPVGEFNVKLSEVLNHPKLYAAYPWAKNLKVMTPATYTRISGQPTQGIGSTIMSAGTNELRGYIVVSKKPPGATRDQYERWVHQQLIHEVQHTIQAREGFARSGGKYPGYWKNAAELEGMEVQRRLYLSPEAQARTSPYSHLIPNWPKLVDVIYKPRVLYELLK